MTQAIPASQFTSTTSGVIAAGGNPLSLNSLWLTDNTAVPIGSIQNFPSQLSVANFFGATSTEATLAAVYFNGFDNSNIKPDGLLFAQFNRTAVSAYLRSGQISSTPLLTLQGMTGTVIATVDGVLKTSASINLSSATSFSAAAALIQAGFTVNPPVVTYDSVRGSFLINSPTTGGGVAFLANTALTTTLTINSVTSGTIQVGQTVVGAGIPADTYIASFGTFTVAAGTGTVILSQAATIAATGVSVTSNASSITVATGTLATSLKLTTATGATLSQGADAAVEANFLNAIVNVETNWVTFMTMWEPLIGSKENFAAWANAQTNRYLYVAYDSDVTAASVANNAICFGNIMAANDYSGVCAIWGPADKAAFLCGSIGSTDYTELRGWVNYAYKQQTGLTPDVTDQTSYVNLLSNGYNCYAKVSLDSNMWNFFQPGSISGPWKWVDNFIDQIVLLNSIQVADITLLTNLKALPADQAGIEILRASTMDPIRAAIKFGSIQTGIELTLGQKAEVNYAAGLKIDQAIFDNGFYLQIIPSVGATRANRIQSRTLWYTSAQGINTLHLSALNVQ
ncbi:MAG: DUF3383 family protein [Candidatus Obscuribacterales bacterium]|jgi:hypothetical protein